MLIIIFLAAAIAMAISAVVHNKREKERKRLERSQFTSYISTFSASEYLDRIEQESIRLQKEREREPQHNLTLWIGLDGLRMDDDGTLQWIRRQEAPKPKPQFNSWDITQCCAISPSTIPSLQVEQTRLIQLQNQNMLLQLQAAQARQNMLLMATIRPAYSYIQNYSPYHNQCLQYNCNIMQK